jgi:hypothetical protein
MERMTPEMLFVLIGGTLAIIFGRMAWGYRYEIADWARGLVPHRAPVSTVSVETLHHTAADYVTPPPAATTDAAQTAPSGGLSVPSGVSSAQLRALVDIMEAPARPQLLTLLLLSGWKTSEIRAVFKGDTGTTGIEIDAERRRLGLPDPPRRLPVYQGRKGERSLEFAAAPLPKREPLP